MLVDATPRILEPAGTMTSTQKLSDIGRLPKDSERARFGRLIELQPSGSPVSLIDQYPKSDAQAPEISAGDPQHFRPVALRPAVGLVAGSVFGLIAAVFYTTSNIALRQSVGVDPFLVTTVKAYPMVMILGPFVLWMRIYNQTILTSAKMVPRFALASFLAHFVGNSCFQFALGIIGLAAAVPITLGVLIVGGAVFGRIILMEPVKPRTLVSMVLIIAAVIILSWPGAADRSRSIALSPSPAWVGALWAIGAGISYSLFGVITRQTLNGGLSAPATMLVSGLVGVLTLTPFTLIRLGLEPLAEVSASQWSVMFAAGFFNFTAFVALTISLKALPVVAVNLLNASQVAMAAIAAVVLFSETITASIVIGILLTFIGLLVLANRNGTRRT